MTHTDVKPKCPYCGQVVQPWETSAIDDGDVYHIDCLAKSEEDAFFDRDMGLGD